MYLVCTLFVSLDKDEEYPNTCCTPYFGIYAAMQMYFERQLYNQPRDRIIWSTKPIFLS